jgi:hypothetical protein
MKQSAYEELGLPVFPDGPFVFSGLQYCNAALAVLVTVRPKKDSQTVRIYVRTVDERTYREIFAPPGEEFWEAFACADAPLAFFSAMRAPAGLVLYRCELPFPVLHPVPPPRMEGEHARVWISALHRASSDGAQLLVTAAIQPQPAAEGGYTIRFVLAHMDAATGIISILADLPATFA